MIKIGLKQIKINAKIGCFEIEKTEGNDFLVDIHFSIPNVRFNNLDDTVDYVEIHELIMEQMAIPCDLIEDVAQRICQKILSTYSLIQTVTLKISKLKPKFENQNVNASWVELTLAS